MTTSVEPSFRGARGRAAYTSAIYGVVSIAAVVVTWQADGNDWHLVEVIAGYVVTLWMMHSYAAWVTTGHFRSWYHVVWDEFPVAAVGLPALAVAVLGQLLGWGQAATADLALLACAITLLSLQTKVVRGVGVSSHRIVMTVVFDMVVAGIILTLHVIV